MNWSRTKTYHLRDGGIYVSFSNDIFLRAKYCYFCKPCFVLCVLVLTFFCLLNCAVSSVYSSRGNSRKRLICYQNLKKNITWVDNRLVVSSVQRISLRIWSGITSVFDEDGCTDRHYFVYQVTCKVSIRNFLFLGFYFPFSFPFTHDLFLSPTLFFSLFFCLAIPLDSWLASRISW